MNLECQFTIIQDQENYIYTCQQCNYQRTLSVKDVYHRFCPKSSDLDPAIKKLELLECLVPALTPHLATWTIKGYPERENWKELILLPCDKRQASGLCSACGCGSTKEKTIYCIHVARMATMNCPAGKF